MPTARDHLLAVEWAVLAVIDEEPTHGFAIARAMEPDGAVGRVWSARRPLVYRAADELLGRGLVRTARSASSPSGPRRTILASTAAGRRALDRWLSEPIEHLRDARSLLMLKLLFLERRGVDARPLLLAQQTRFTVLERRLAARLKDETGYARTLALWRVENARAANRFLTAQLTAVDDRP